MINAEKLKEKMRPGKVYRRQGLVGFSTALDRDLNTLVVKGEVLRLAPGLYCRPLKNSFGLTPPDDRELVRVFLKTDDFLLTSYNYFNQLRLGLTQVHNDDLVYNHKRSGEFTLGGKRFTFRVVPAYPRELTKEFLLVDLLNNLRNLPDNNGLVLQNLKSRFSEFNPRAIRECLEQYGRPASRAALQEVHAYCPVP
ncbi:MAG: hypothetical protein KBD85_02310 [Elusimicrobia bacterium]|nr:hypothetical protein [Elusimicrobiota bacterium]MBP9698828.1 hypothetical protein [Elusimicrobiota bacterium]